MKKNIQNLNLVRQLALNKGASDAAIIKAGDIRVEKQLADLCRQPPCENYGLSPGCPPHVKGPEGFIELQGQCSYAVVVRIDTPAALLFSDERQNVMGQLHRIVAQIEGTARQMGYPLAKAFASGACKSVFCQNHRHCRILAENKPCRHPESARPSMSGFGINVSRLMQTAGWPDKNLFKDGKLKAPDPEAMAWVAGLVMIG